ncbi:MAG TPA: hypothetical protein DCQ06_14310, partial [Myxococcales bacterium]|nr:hypothetical protein [Myxococcales bacterium]
MLEAMSNNVTNPLDLWQEATDFSASEQSRLDRWQQSLEKLSHDLNNALVPLHAKLDVLHMQLGVRGDESIDKMREALRNITDVLQTSTHWHKDEGRSSLINGAELRFRWEQTCQRFGIEMRWEVDLQAWGVEHSQDLSACLEVLVRNSCDALKQQRAPTQRRIDVYCRGDKRERWLRVQDNGGGCVDLPTCIGSN